MENEFLELIKSFEDIKFSYDPEWLTPTEKYPDASSNFDPENHVKRATIDLGDVLLSVVGGSGMYGDGIGSFEVAFLDKDTREFVEGSNYLNDDIGGFISTEPQSYVSKDTIMRIIESKKSNNNKEVNIKKFISSQLMELVFLEKKERKESLEFMAKNLDLNDDLQKKVSEILLGIASESEKPKLTKSKKTKQRKTKTTKSEPESVDFSALIDEELDFCSAIDECLI